MTDAVQAYKAFQRSKSNEPFNLFLIKEAIETQVLERGRGRIYRFRDGSAIWTLRQGKSTRKTVIVPPPGGWTKGYFVVEVSFKYANPVHRSILHVSGAEDGIPSGSIFNPTYGQVYGSMEPIYLHGIARLEVGESDGRLPFYDLASSVFEEIEQ